jgi:dTDP-4-dehydrorhamnose reductase
MRDAKNPAENTGSILITGASGQVGGELVRLLASLGTIHAPTRAELDLADPASIRRAVQTLRPRWIVNPAAYTAVDRAESDREAAFAINATAPGILGEEAARINAAVLHFSTDYVFSGDGTNPYRESDPTGPLGVYGASKLAGEQALAASGAAHIILRTSWVYGTTGRNFLLTILRLARERESLTVVNDQHGAPTWSRDLARLAAIILTQAPDAEAARRFQGTYHATAQGEVTWFGFAQEALRLSRRSGLDTRFARLTPVTTRDYPTPARRPSNSRLDCTLLASTFAYSLPPWQQSLASVMEELFAASPAAPAA